MPDKSPDTPTEIPNGGSDNADSAVESHRAPAPEEAVSVQSANSPEQAPRSALSLASDGDELIAEETITAAGWHNSKTITRLYHSGPQNSWIALGGVGWKRISPSNESAVGAMTIIASHALDNDLRVNAYEGSDGHIHQIYCW